MRWTSGRQQLYTHDLVMSQEISHYESVQGCLSSPLGWLYILLMVVVGVALFFEARSLGMLIRRRWKPALINIAVGVGIIAAAGVASVLFGGLLIDSLMNESVPPDQKARYLGESISCGMNWGFWAWPLGVLAGLVDAVWRQKEKREQDA